MKWMLILRWVTGRKKSNEKTFNYFEIVSAEERKTRTKKVILRQQKKRKKSATKWNKMILLFILSYGLCFCRQFAGVSSAFLHQYAKDGYNTFDDTSTIFPSHNSITASKWNEPYFDNSVGNNVTALVGKSAYLTCKVRNLGNKTVSIITSIWWILNEYTRPENPLKNWFQITINRSSDKIVKILKYKLH